MNYLAHLFLAEKSDHCLIGSLAGDFVKGPLKGNFPPRMEKGILFHRRLDRFVDEHPLTIEAKEMTSSQYRRYSGIMLDLMNDYFLSKNWESYTTESRTKFIAQVYRILSDHQKILPEKMQGFLPRMIEQNWLEEYRTQEGIIRTLLRVQTRLSRTTPFQEKELRKEIERLSEEWERVFLQLFPRTIELAREHHSLKL